MYNVSNDTLNSYYYFSRDDEYEINWKHPLLGVLLILFCLITIIGNFLVIFAVLRERYLKSATNYYIASLALADLLVGLIVMPNAALHEMSNNIWLFGQLWCDLWHSFDVFASTASINSLLVIALDRHSAISDPISYHTRWLTHYWMFYVAVIWIGSAIISFPAIAYWRFIIAKNHNILTDIKLLQCAFTDDFYYLVFSSLVSFYIPLSIMIFVYIRIYRAATRQMIALKTGQKTDLKNPDLTLRIHRGGYHGAPGTRVAYTRDKNVKIKNEKIEMNNKKNSRDDKISAVSTSAAAAVAAVSTPKNKFLSSFKSLNKSKKAAATNTNISQIATYNGGEYDDSIFEDNLIYLENTTANNVTTTTGDVLKVNEINSIKNIDVDSASVMVTTTELSLPLKKSNSNEQTIIKAYSVKNYHRHFPHHGQHHIRHDSSGSALSGASSSATNATDRYSKVKLISKKMLNFNLTKKFCKFSREQKAAKTLGIVMGVFICCWLPFFIYNVITGIFKAKLPKSHELIYSIFTWLGYINSGMNPIIYAFSSRDFRRAFYKILCPTSFMRNHQHLATRDAALTSNDHHSKRNNVVNMCQVYEGYASSVENNQNFIAGDANQTDAVASSNIILRILNRIINKKVFKIT